mgnify:CR=1 FL=1
MVIPWERVEAILLCIRIFILPFTMVSVRITINKRFLNTGLKYNMTDARPLDSRAQAVLEELVLELRELNQNLGRETVASKVIDDWRVQKAVLERSLERKVR